MIDPLKTRIALVEVSTDTFGAHAPLALDHRAYLVELEAFRVSVGVPSRLLRDATSADVARVHAEMFRKAMKADIEQLCRTLRVPVPEGR